MGQSKRKDQIQFSEMMVGISLIGMMIVMLIGFIMSVIA
jgi:hypothetical protein